MSPFHSHYNNFDFRFQVVGEKMASGEDYKRMLATERVGLKEKLGFRIPDFSKISFVLLGKNESENSQVGNLILGTVAFNSEAPPDEKIHHCSQRVGGMLKKRHVTVIINSQLLQRNISDHQITQTVRECVYLSDPGPPAFILVLQHNDFTEDDLRRVKCVLKEFSEEAIKHTIVLTTDEETHRAEVNESIQELTAECGGGHLQVKDKKLRSQIFKRVKNTLKGEYFLGKMKETPMFGSSVDAEDSISVDSDLSEDENIDESHKVKKEERSTFSFLKFPNPLSRRDHSPDGNRPNMSTLNLVVCGSNETLTSSVSDLIRQQTDRKSDVGLHDPQFSLMELPALIGLSEEEVMRQTLCCVSRCHPGVHAFLLVIPAGPLTNEDKAEIEKIQNIFDSREHFIVLFTSNLPVNEPVTDFVKSSTGSRGLISHFGGQYKVIGLKEPGNSRQIPELLDYIKNMKTEPYSLQMYVKAQENRVRHELEEQHKKELKRKENEINELQQKIRSEGTKEVIDDLKCLRIVLIGRTGNGKSATGNTILGRKEFESELRADSVTTVCMKGVAEVEGRSVAVVDTPGLFDNKVSNDHVVEEIVKCISLSSPGPHVFVIVLSVGRFTKEEADTVDLIKKIFGAKAAQFSIVLFTRGDDLENKSIDKYVSETQNAEFKKLIRDCGDRFLVFNNREKQDKTQVIDLINMIEEVKNQRRYFTNSMFEEAEMSIKKRMEEIMKEKEREIQTQKDELQDKYETDMKNMKERLEEEKQRAEEERIQRENEFRQKKENLIKEFEEKEKKQQMKQETENHTRSEEEKQKRAEFHQKIEEMKREIESQRSQYEKQQKEREEEDRKREERYRQDQEKLKNEQERIIAELQMKQEEETKKRESEERKRVEQEEKQREEWKRKIKEAEHDRKETQEDIKRQQREWEDEKKRQMREREEEERKIKEKHKEELKEKQKELEEMRKRFEREREEERQKIEDERQKQKREREEKEREYEEKKQKMERHYEEMEQKRKEEWERKKREDDERREEERKRWERKIEDLKQKQEEEIKRKEKEEEKRKETEEKERDEMKQKHDEEIKEMKKKHEDEARKQAEELNERKEQHVQELQQMLEEHQKQHELLEKLYQHLQTQRGEETRELQKQVEEMKSKSRCVIM